MKYKVKVSIIAHVAYQESSLSAFAARLCSLQGGTEFHLRDCVKGNRVTTGVVELLPWNGENFTQGVFCFFVFRIADLCLAFMSYPQTPRRS